MVNFNSESGIQILIAYNLFSRTHQSFLPEAPAGASQMGSSLPLTLTDIVLFFPYLIFNFSATFFSIETLW
jgi:hypothetical protein